MSLQLMGLSQINGPLVVIDHLPRASFEEMVETPRTGWQYKIGKNRTDRGSPCGDTGLSGDQWDFSSQYHNTSFGQTDGNAVVTRDTRPYIWRLRPSD